jgi:hypothetical protein
MVLVVQGTPNYRGAKSYVNYSPDGKYRLDNIYPKKGYIYNIITLLPENKVVVIDNIPLVGELSISDLWFCNNTYTNCTGYTYDISDPSCTINLPPSWWQQLKAWLIIKTKHLENPDFKIMRVDDNRRKNQLRNSQLSNQ